MSRIFLTHIDLNGNELQNARVQNLASAPGSPGIGQLYLDTTVSPKRLYYWNGTAWVAADGSSISFGTVTNSAVADAAVNGVATTASRSDHVHGREAWGGAPATTIGIGQAAAAGSATTPSRSDHVHPLAAAAAPAASAVGDTVVTGSATTFAASDHKHAREAFATNAVVLGTAAAAGAATTLIRSDATIAAFDATAATASAPGDSAAAGSVAFAARRDHVHAREQTFVKQTVRAATTTSGTLATSFANTQVIDGVTLATGDRILIKDQGDANNGIYIVQAAGAPVRATDADTSAEVLTGMLVPVSEGTVNADTVWTMTNNGVIVLNTTTLVFAEVAGLVGGTASTSAVGDAAANGTAVTVARSDHKHAREGFATPAVVLGTAAAAGAATTHIRSDATIAAFDATAPTTSAVADAAAVGSVAFAARRDHVHGREAWGGAPATTEGVGQAAAAGSATTPSRSDHVHPMAAAAAPAASAVGDTVVTGVATTPAASDHKHAREAFGAVTAQTSYGASSANGSATTLARSDHVHGTPTHVAADHSAIKISDLAAPTAAVAFGSQRITGVADPTGLQDAATKNYVDSVAAGLDVHPSVKFASTANVAGTYNATGGTSGRGQFTAMSNAAIDGVTLVAGDRVLLKDQSTGAQNGVYVITTLGSGANGVWDRATDFDQDAEVTAGAFLFVEQGTVNADTGWVLATDNPITIGGASGTALVFTQFSSAAAISAGAGLLKTGGTIDAVAGTTPATSAGPGGGLKMNADDMVIDATIVARKYTTQLTGSTTSYTVTHNLANQWVTVQVVENSGAFRQVEVEVELTDANTCTIRFTTAPTSNAYRAIVVG